MVMRVYLLRVGHEAELSSFAALMSSGIPSPAISSTAFRTSSTCAMYILQRVEKIKDITVKNIKMLVHNYENRIFDDKNCLQETVHFINVLALGSYLEKCFKNTNFMSFLTS